MFVVKFCFRNHRTVYTKFGVARSAFKIGRLNIVGTVGIKKKVRGFLCLMKDGTMETCWEWRHSST
jgi:hypothetical protein